MSSVLLLLAAAGCAGVNTAETAQPMEPDPVEQARTEEEPPPPADADIWPCDGNCDPLTTDFKRSFVVTDATILARFPLRRVMDQLAGLSGTTSTGDSMWRQWWSSQRNRDPLNDPANHPFCDDSGATINGFPIQCPRAESVLEHVEMESHVPVALVNRFDLAPMDGAHCGEYRIVYALREGGYGEGGEGERNFVIFEGQLPNPSPECELAGCIGVAEFWQDLTYIDDVNTRADLLDEFYFEGSCGYEPVVKPEHYGMNCRGTGGGYGGGCGQIRTNQFMERDWNLREFVLEQDCTAPGCEAIVQQTTVKQNPHVDVWKSTHPLYPGFESEILAQLPLNQPNPDDVDLMMAQTSGRYDAGESISTFGGFNFNDYDADATFESVIAGSGGLQGTVTEFDIEERVTAQSCAGCHELSNFDQLGHAQGLSPDVEWPPSLGFVHIDEGSNLSPALLNHFIPHRQTVLFNFLATTCGHDCYPADGLTLVKASEQSDAETGDAITTFELVTEEEAAARQEGEPEFDTLSGDLVH